MSPTRSTQGRVLVIVNPDSKMPPDEIRKFFEALTQKNNLLVLTGEKTAMASVEAAARQHYAAQKADGRIAQGHPQREDLERKQQGYAQGFNSTILGLFDKVLFPIHRSGKDPQLVDKPLDQTRDAREAVQRRGPDREDADDRPAEALRGHRRGV